MDEKSKSLKITVITVCFNAAMTIEKTLKSIAEQDYKGEIEHILIDGGSIDGTLEIIQDYLENITFFSSEADNGIYDAMNKGLGVASGDIVMFLNADDTLASANILSKISKLMLTYNPDFIFGNVRMVCSNGQIKRFWKPDSSCAFTVKKHQIPHPAFIVKRAVIEQCKPAFDDSLKIAADLKQQLILIDKLGKKGYYLNETIAVMLLGGASTNGLLSYISGWKESIVAYNSVFGYGGFLFTIRKLIVKIKQLNYFTSSNSNAEKSL